MENIGNMEHGKYKNYLKFDHMEINNIKGAEYEFYSRSVAINRLQVKNNRRAVCKVHLVTAYRRRLVVVYNDCY